MTHANSSKLKVNQLSTLVPNEDGDMVRVMLNVEKPEDIEEQVAIDSQLELVALPTPPDGGYGWIVVAASFMCIGIVDGISFSFGLYLNDFAAHFNVSTGLAALSGSMMAGICFLLGPITSGLMNQFGTRPVVITGAIIASTGLFFSVFAPRFIHFCILYGVFGGIGTSFVYLPAIVHVGFYFEKKRAVATGIAVGGSGIGIATVSSISPILLAAFNWQGTQWILAGLMLQCAVFGALMRPVESKRQSKQEVVDQNKDSDEIVLQEKLKIEGNPRRSSTTSTDIFGSQRGRTRFQSFARSRGILDDIVAQSVIKLPILPVQNESNKLANDGFSSPELSLKQRRPLVQHQISAVESCNAGMDERRRNNPRYLLQQNKTKISIQSFKKCQSHSRLPFSNSGGDNNNDQDIKQPQPPSTIQGLHPKDFARPLYRNDAFYTGSVQNLPEYEWSKGDINVYRENTISVPHNAAVVYDETTQSLIAVNRGQSGIMRILPLQIRNVCMEMLDFRLVKDPVMMLLLMCSAFGCLGLYIPFVYTCDKVIRLGATSTQAGILLGICGLSNSLGRVAFGWIADNTRFSANTLVATTLILCGVSTGLASLIYNYYFIAVYVAIFGFFLSAFMSLASIVVVDYFGLEKLTNGFGLLMLSRGIFAAMGSPIGGMVFNTTKSYAATYCYAGAMMIIAGVAAFAIHFVTMIEDHCCAADFDDDQSELGNTPNPDSVDQSRSLLASRQISGESQGRHDSDAQYRVQLEEITEHLAEQTV